MDDSKITAEQEPTDEQEWQQIIEQEQAHQEYIAFLVTRVVEEANQDHFVA